MTEGDGFEEEIEEEDKEMDDIYDEQSAQKMEETTVSKTGDKSLNNLDY